MRRKILVIVIPAKAGKFQRNFTSVVRHESEAIIQKKH